MIDYRHEWNERIKRAQRILPSVKDATKALYCDEALVNLLDAGWHVTRAWDAGEVERYERVFASEYPDCVHRFVQEYGGLNIGIEGRTIDVGSIREYSFRFPKLLEQTVGTRLYPVGETDILCDDALGVLMDDSGRFYVDGATSDLPPQDYCVGMVAVATDSFFNQMFADPGCILEETHWIYYSPPKAAAGAE